MNNPATSRAAQRPTAAIILAAGQGKRMGLGDLPKVLVPAADQPMLHWVVAACQQVGVDLCVMVIGHQGERVREAMAGEHDCVFVEQTQRLGTGHAAMMATPVFEGRPPCDVFVLAGDGCLIQAATLEKLLATHRNTDAAATLATAVIDDPTGYGRVIRDAAGHFVTIVEEKDASDEERAIREINPSYYCFKSEYLFDYLARLKNDNRQGEYYLTDVPAMMQDDGLTVAAIQAVPPQDALSVNTPEQLAQVDRILRDRRSDQARKATSP